LFIAALLLIQQYPHSFWIMTAALPAFCLEICFYLSTMLAETRSFMARLRPELAQALLLWTSALVPYLIFAMSAGTVQVRALELLLLLTGLVSFWFFLMPRRPAYDVGFLIITAAPLITRTFPHIYVSPNHHLRIDVLGHLMWIRIGVFALLIFRGWNPGSFGLWPGLRDWQVGVVYYLVVIIPLGVIANTIGEFRFAPIAGPWWQIILTGVATFFGVLWVVALAEELFFRGFIERALLDIRVPTIVAVIVSAVLFGCVHLWFRHFPDWRHALIAGMLGIGCGYAYAQTGSVRAPMVTHACTVLTWRMLFR
jgi:membrane protease YdiL (CAAX protease family)